MNPDAQCIIMTTEILRNILYRYNAMILKIGAMIGQSLINSRR